MERKITYTPHLLFRIRLREIPYSLPRKIYQTARERFFDSYTGNYIAVKEIRHKKTSREMIVVYSETEVEIKLITIHPLKSYQKQARIMSGRWKKA